jgi:8-amino-7-oxononanoate synthase
MSCHRISPSQFEIAGAVWMRDVVQSMEYGVFNKQVAQFTPDSLPAGFQRNRFKLARYTSQFVGTGLAVNRRRFKRLEMMDMNRIRDQLAQLDEQQLLRTRRIVSGPQGPLLTIDDKQYLAFCSNDYLGLANHPALVAAAHAGLDTYGVGASASALISGHTRAYEELEIALARFVGMPRALHFSTGYMANLGIIPALVGAGDTVFSDQLNHACLIDGARLSRAEVTIYPHADTQRLEQLLKESVSPRKLVATDAVFSMDGDIAPLPKILAIC